MEISEILNYILGGTSLMAIIGFIIYRKENRKLKQNEVKKDDAATQREQIELADLYKNKVVELTELMAEMAKKQDSGNENQATILKKLDSLSAQSEDHGRKLDTIDSRVDGQETRLADIVTYLNGDFQEYLKRNKPTTKKKSKTNED
jgi:chromosome segregation ATPase